MIRALIESRLACLRFDLAAFAAQADTRLATVPAATLANLRRNGTASQPHTFLSAKTTRRK
jgi:hypothetical protein